ncbi:tRNA-dihydrouridine synthase [Motiliproteus sp. SC1-56]|uniref:tRNA dihydrouridine synthase n=1 Tax=Motiliproteus sp. SC1-56 TaxID=2799565 RepID=UPI001F5E0492|nr:tRNA-dihydrouridine synthase [Motiliproteus sp. SC1-56]
MKIILAPMEGVVDALMRDLLTRIGGIDRCVTEFVRVSDRELPNRVFYRLAPELRRGSRTPAGTPVHVQLLGSDPELLAANAARAVRLGALGIDLNFGCPAKTVNRSQGGAILLQDPGRIYAIVCAVRRAVPEGVGFSAKMRLGYEDDGLSVANAQAMVAGGVEELCVHGRTKREGYRPPARWHAIDRVRQAVAVPVIANGDIWSPADAVRCQAQSGCRDLMLGRGLLSRPGLAQQIKGSQAPLAWETLQPWISEYFERLSDELAPRYAPGRIKQWLAYLRRHYPEAALLFEQIKRETRNDLIQQQLAALPLGESASA